MPFVYYSIVYASCARYYVYHGAYYSLYYKLYYNAYYSVYYCVYNYVYYRVYNGPIYLIFKLLTIYRVTNVNLLIISTIYW